MAEDLIELVRRDNTLINKETGEEAKVLKTYKSRVIITVAVSSKDFFGEFDEENFLESGEDTENAIDGFKNLHNYFPNYKTVLLTGRNPQITKTELMSSFKRKKVDILVSTIIAEVGLDNPNATVMVVEGADRFGLSNLHQLRGRICRSTDTAFCFLVAETVNQKSIDRLDVMEKCNDGFEIAEHDLRLRGPGEMFSTRQHGLPDLKFASILDDYALLVKAKDMAVEIYDKLDSPEYAGLKEMLKIKYSETLKLAGVA